VVEALLVIADQPALCISSRLAFSTSSTGLLDAAITLQPNETGHLDHPGSSHRWSSTPTLCAQILNFGLPAQIDVRTVGYDRAKNLQVAKELRRRIAVALLDTSALHLDESDELGDLNAKSSPAVLATYFSAANSLVLAMKADASICRSQ
jgi:hypothetical protein